MLFLRACEKDSGVNTDLALFLVGDGEAGKTSVMKALMNDKGNTAEHIGKDTRTVGMDMHDWKTKDTQGADLTLKIKDVGKARLHETPRPLRAGPWIATLVDRFDRDQRGGAEVMSVCISVACRHGVLHIP